MPAGSIGEEISHLKKKGISSGPRKGSKVHHKQAIAIALSMARKGEFGKAEQHRAVGYAKKRKKKPKKKSKKKQEAMQNLKRVVTKFRKKK